jgi:Holliday junction resolvase
MAKQKESRLQRRIRLALLEEFGGWWVKIWGGPFQSGIPDLIGCVQGLFFALEVKTAKGKASTLQLETIHEIVTEGFGASTVVRTVKHAIQFVRDSLEAAGRLPAKRGKVRVPKENKRTVLRAGDRKDVDRRGSARVLNVRPKAFGDFLSPNRRAKK